MSIVDPRVARIQSHDVVFTGTVAGWLAAFLAVLHSLTWLIAALAAGATLDVLRSLIIDAGDADGSFRLLAGWPLIVIVLIGFMLGSAVHSAAERVTSEAASSALRFATALVGLTAGLVAYVPRWTPPETVGSRPTYWASGERAWGALEWVAYWAPNWLPALSGVLAVATTVMAASLILRRINAKFRVAAVLTGGIHTTGYVTEVRWAEPDGKGRHIVRFTVTYADRSGQQRWIERVVRLHKDEIPQEGSVADVWYDRERPDDLKRIAVDVRGTGIREVVPDESTS